MKARRTTLLLLVTISPGCRPKLVPDAAIRAELLRRVVGDQALRDTAFSFFRNGGAGPDSSMVRRLQAQDSVNGEWLKAILRRYQWPGISSVGRDGARAAFLLLEHARNDRAFQAATLPLIEAAYRRGDVDGQDLALLTDELLRDAGRPQRYGSKAQILNGKLVVEPIEDSVHLDERRAKLGLVPFAVYVRFMDSVYGLPSH